MCKNSKICYLIYESISYEITIVCFYVKTIDGTFRIVIYKVVKFLIAKTLHREK